MGSIAFRPLALAAAVGLLGAGAIADAQAATVTYNNSASFTAQLGFSVTDDYENPSYVFIQSNAVMSAVLGETKYKSTGFTDLNIVTGGSDQYYCAGCNGSFILDFKSTSVGTASGVFGVGFGFFNTGENDVFYSAFVTFGDGSTANYAFPLTSNFPNSDYFGITSDLLIATIAFGLPDGETTIQGNFGIDNLTVGAASEVPLPAALPLFAAAIAGVGGWGAVRRRKAA